MDEATKRAAAAQAIRELSDAPTVELEGRRFTVNGRDLSVRVEGPEVIGIDSWDNGREVFRFDTEAVWLEVSL